jgi:hypothetical protein
MDEGSSGLAGVSKIQPRPPYRRIASVAQVFNLCALAIGASVEQRLSGGPRRAKRRQVQRRIGTNLRALTCSNPVALKPPFTFPTTPFFIGKSTQLGLTTRKNSKSPQKMAKLHFDFLPALELLEDRVVPATINSITYNDAIGLFA